MSISKTIKSTVKTQTQSGTRLDKSVYIDYTNWQGVRSIRHIQPVQMGVFFGATQRHTEPQWFMRAIDLDKNELESFAMRNIHAFGVEPKDETDTPS